MFSITIFTFARPLHADTVCVDFENGIFSNDTYTKAVAATSILQEYSYTIFL